MKMNKKLAIALSSTALLLGSSTVFAACTDISYAALTDAAKAAAQVTNTGGYSLPMWVTFVDESGKICAVTTSNDFVGKNAGNKEWLGSRVISAQKAFTANAFSLDGYAISTANLYAAVQPGGSLFGLQHSNPVDASVAYAGSPNAYGTKNDPLKGKRIGGVNVFGGGLAVYKDGKTKIGAIGVSGDTSCRDHAFAWQVRTALSGHPLGNNAAVSTTLGTGITTFNMNAAGTAQINLTGAAKGDEMILSSGSSNYWNAWAQPGCPNSTPAATVANGTLIAP